jgi:non-ribosomal peptide synthetase component E (peptide arylation enzyme)
VELEQQVKNDRGKRMIAMLGAAYDEIPVKMAKEKLAPYEVPKLLEIREELPLTVIGKVDKKILRKETS